MNIKGSNEIPSGLCKTAKTDREKELEFILSEVLEAWYKEAYWEWGIGGNHNIYNRAKKKLSCTQ